MRDHCVVMKEMESIFKNMSSKNAQCTQVIVTIINHFSNTQLKSNRSLYNSYSWYFIMKDLLKKWE